MHTEGPYVIGGLEEVSTELFEVPVYAPQAPEGSRLPFTARGATEDEAMANAQAVEALPDLLASLMEAWAALARCGEAPYALTRQHTTLGMHERIAAAIAAARGEAAS